MSATDDPPADTAPEHGTAADRGTDAPQADSGPADSTATGDARPDDADAAPRETTGGVAHDDDPSPRDAPHTADPRATAPGGPRAATPSRPGQRDTGQTDQAEALEGLEAFNSALAFTGNAYTLNVGTSPPAEFQRIPVDTAETSRAHRLHQEVADQEAMATCLAEHHLVVLYGPNGSGREHTALFLLAGRCGSAGLSVLHGDEARLTQALIEQNGRRLRAGQGIRVDVGTHLPAPATLDALRRRARERGSYVVLMVEDARSEPGDLGPHGFHHRRPEPRPVLAAHLGAALEEHRTRCTPEQDDCTHQHRREFKDRILQDPRTQAALATAASVDWVTRFARDLAACLHEPAETLDTLLDTPHGDLRSVARRYLKPPQPQTSAPVIDPHQQALRIVYVLGHDLPLSDVIRMGAVLSTEVLRAENRDTVPARQVFEADLDRLVPPGTGIAAAPGTGLSDNPRRARIADPELMPAVAEVIWHDLPWLREPMVECLKKLARDDLERVRTRAAVIAGHLLRHDFDSVYRDLVKLWAVSKWMTDRRCAALAMAVARAADRPWLTERIEKQVADWARSPRTEFQDSAARAYGTPVGTGEVPGTLPALEALAGRPELVLYASVAYSTAALFFAPGGAEPVAEALGRWVRSRNANLPRHAARALLVIGPFAVGPELPSRPRLAQQAMADAEREETLLLLWRRALIEPAHSGRAWQLLRQWLLAADEDEELARFLEKFVPRVCLPRLGNRAAFHLRRWARLQPDARCVAQLLLTLSRL
ncbi:hypothetical protein ABZ471_08550 [Streptomyces sp. NPDC005728]|uniref:hypothetical protein n=1 Tax=Streptomyces sp. NPDC005728 TaxID=3157054 RepID=UPI0034044950